VSLDPRVTDLGADVRLDWTPDLKGQGYRLYVDGFAVSRTFKPDASSTTFRKPDDEPHRYGLRVMSEVGALEEVTFPLPEPEPTPGLPFPAVPLESPIIVLAPNLDGALNLPAGSAGRDVLVDLRGREGAVRQGLVITDNAAGPPRNMRVENGHSRCTKPTSGSGYWHGGIRLATKAQKVEVRDFFNEARGVLGYTGTDGIGVASAPWTEWTVQRCLIEMPSDSTVANAHLDVFQVQGPLRSVKIGLLSGDMAGVRQPNDQGKGFQLALEPWGGSDGNPFTAELTKIDLELLGTPATGARSGGWMVQEFRDGPSVKFGPECYYQCSDALVAAFGDNFPVTIYPHLRTATDYGVVSGSRPNRKLSWATKPQAGFTGEFYERPSGSPRFVTRTMLGY
jgi:hypothetical protein